MKNKIILIVGNKRSGSTHIARLLNVHDKVFISNETSIFWILYRFHNDLKIVPHEDDSGKGLRRAMNACGHVLSKRKSPYENFVSFQKKAMKEGLGHWDSMKKRRLCCMGDQKPYQNTDKRVVNFVSKYFDDVRMIHPVRHPLSQIISAASHPSGLWSDLSLRELQNLWIKHEKKVKKIIEKKDIPLVHVRLEDMQTKVESEIEKIEKFLGIEFDDEEINEARKMTKSKVSVHANVKMQEKVKKMAREYGYSEHTPFFLASSYSVRALNKVQNLFINKIFGKKTIPKVVNKMTMNKGKK